jgi:hypothetical protein
VLEPGTGVVNRGVAAADVRDAAVTATIGGTPGAPAVPVTLTVGGREAARGLAAPGEQVSFPLPALSPGWWVGEVQVAHDELRSDDSRPVAWRVTPPARVGATTEAGPFIGAVLSVLQEGGRVTPGSDVRFGAPPAPGAVVMPPADGALLGATNRALAAVGAGWRFGPPGTPGSLVDSAGMGAGGVAVGRRRRRIGAGGDVLATVNGEAWLVRTGGMLLIGSRLDTVWTALPTTPQFLPFVDRLVRDIAAGARAIQTAEGAPGVAFETRGADTVGATVSGIDARESDLTPAEPGQVRRSLGATPVAAAGFAAARFGGGRRTDAGPALLLVALVLAGLEVLVAWRTR